MGPHNNIAVVGMTFIILGQQHGNFYGQLSKKCRVISPLLVARIGGIIDFVANKGLVTRRVSSGLNGAYPNVSPAPGQGHWEGVIKNTQINLQALAISGNLKKAMECTIGIQEAIIMQGIDKVLGAITSTTKSAYNYAKIGHTTYDYTMKAADAAKKYAALYEKLGKVKNPADAFIAAM